jgi:hypothetical protein
MPVLAGPSPRGNHVRCPFDDPGRPVTSLSVLLSATSHSVTRGTHILLNSRLCSADKLHILEVAMSDTSPHDGRFGQLLVREGVIDDDKLQQALSLQAKKTDYRPLGDILRQLGFITPRKLRDMLLRYKKQIPLGQLLVKMNVITNEQLREAMVLQGRSSSKLGSILVEKGFVKKTLLAEALCIQLGVACADAIECQSDRKLLDKVNVAFLRSRKVMPLQYDKQTNTVVLLMEDPTDQEALADLEKIFKATVEPVMLRDGWVECLLDDFLDVWHSSSTVEAPQSARNNDQSTLRLALAK